MTRDHEEAGIQGEKYVLSVSGTFGLLFLGLGVHPKLPLFGVCQGIDPSP